MGVNHAVLPELLEENYSYRRLCDEHEKLEQQLSQLRQHPIVDAERVSTLKKMKLRVVDRMSLIERATLERRH